MTSQHESYRVASVSDADDFILSASGFTSRKVTPLVDAPSTQAADSPNISPDLLFLLCPLVQSSPIGQVAFEQLLVHVYHRTLLVAVLPTETLFAAHTGKLVAWIATVYCGGLWLIRLCGEPH